MKLVRTSLANAREASSSSQTFWGSVETKLGAIALTRIPSGARPAASERVSAVTPPLAAV